MTIEKESPLDILLPPPKFTEGNKKISSKLI
jgi:hypothetical protein